MEILPFQFPNLLAGPGTTAREVDSWSVWFEVAPPHRVIRYEDLYGPPSAPEVVLELCNP